MPRLLAMGVATVTALVLSACGDDATRARANPTSPTLSTVPATTAPAPGASTATPPRATAAPTTYEVTYKAGAVSGDTGRLKVKLGTKVTVRVSSDVADEAHLHGYDMGVKVPAGGSAVLSFTANIPGGFALELEELGKQLTRFQVQ